MSIMCGRENDRRSQWPRYQKEAFEKNLALVESVRELADKKGCTPGQLALAWVHAQVRLALDGAKCMYVRPFSDGMIVY